MTREQAISKLVGFTLASCTGAYEPEQAQEIVEMLNTAAGYIVCKVVADISPEMLNEIPQFAGMCGIERGKAMNNPFDAATPHLIECFEANYRAGFIKPNYPVPAIQTKIKFDRSELTGRILGLELYTRQSYKGGEYFQLEYYWENPAILLKNSM